MAKRELAGALEPSKRIETVTLELDGYAVDVLLPDDAPEPLLQKVIACRTRGELAAVWDELAEHGVGLADPVALPKGMLAGIKTDFLAKTFRSGPTPKPPARWRAATRAARIVMPLRRPACRPAAHRPASRRASGPRSGSDPGEGGECEPPPRPWPRRRTGGDLRDLLHEDHLLHVGDDRLIHVEAAR
jgi:hypothetical protein